ncbi:MAG TPA: FG-GAP repeat protein, partial [Dokdonella sp.]
VGATLVFMQAGSVWSQRARLSPPAGVPGDRFGWAVALAPDAEVLVGAPYALDGCGAATLYARAGVGWHPTSRAALDAPLAETMAGWAVAVSNQRLAVAAPGHAGALEHRGGVHLFGGGDAVFRDGFEPDTAILACEGTKRSAIAGEPRR